MNNVLFETTREIFSSLELKFQTALRMDRKLPIPAKQIRSNYKSGRKRTVHGNISKGAIRRLARRGGVKRLSALIYDEMRLVLRKYLESLVKDTVVYCEYFKRTTIRAEDVVLALRSRGQRLYGFDDPPFPITIRTSIKLSDAPVENSLPSTWNLSDTETNVDESGTTNIENTEMPANGESSSANNSNAATASHDRSRRTSRRSAKVASFSKASKSILPNSRNSERKKTSRKTKTIENKGEPSSSKNSTAAAEGNSLSKRNKSSELSRGDSSLQPRVLVENLEGLVSPPSHLNPNEDFDSDSYLDARLSPSIFACED